MNMVGQTLKAKKSRFKRDSRHLSVFGTPSRNDAGAAPGFTIIEVLMVLAVAGIIMLIVFQAIPTLERSGRNNQRKQDVQAILAAVSHWELTNSGDIPQPSDSYLQYAKLTYYNASSDVQIVPFVYNAGVGLRPPVGAVTDIDKVGVYNYAKCAPIGSTGAVGTGAGYNDVVALYAIETGTGGSTPQCQQL